MFAKVCFEIKFKVQTKTAVMSRAMYWPVHNFYFHLAAGSMVSIVSLSAGVLQSSSLGLMESSRNIPV